MSEKLRVAAYGCGKMQKALQSQLATLEQAQLVAAIDSSLDQAQKMAEEFGAQPFVSFQAACEVVDFDAVFVATPGYLHADCTIEALEAGKHVFCEKPMAFTVADCDRMIAAAEAAGKQLMIGQVLRYLPLFQKILDLVAIGEYGRPFATHVKRVWKGWGGAWVSWRNERSKVGGMLFEVNVHEIDFMRCLFGEAKRVACEELLSGVADIDYADVVQVLIGFEDAQGVLTSALSSAIGYYDGQIWCTEGTLFYDMNKGEILAQRLDEETPKTFSVRDFAGDYEDGTHREVREFVEAVLQNTPVTIPGSEGRANVEIAEAAGRAATEHRVIELPLV